MDPRPRARAGRPRARGGVESARPAPSLGTRAAVALGDGFRSPVPRITRASGHPGLRSSGPPVTRASGHPGLRSPGPPVTRTSGHPGLRSPGPPVTRTSDAVATAHDGPSRPARAPTARSSSPGDPPDATTGCAQALRRAVCELAASDCGQRLWTTQGGVTRLFEQFSTGSPTPVETGEAQ